MNNPTEPNEEITRAVRQKYGELAIQQLENPGAASCCCGGGNCCGGENGLNETASDLYALEQIAGLPETVTSISLGCGNPSAIAGLQPGQTVLDLGSGGGVDCFLAARQVGESGRVIGLDMTPAMLDLARANAKKLGLANVEFQYGYIEDIPLPDASVDAIISNCVINLSADKAAVFREAYRVLKPGGVLNVSDIVTYGELPDELRGELSAWAGCVSGALDEGEYLALLRAAGFARVDVLERKHYPPELLMEYESIRSLLADGRLALADLSERIASITLQAFR
jgi:SAM-dependent methyltransferase